MKRWLGRRYSKQEVNLGIAFLKEGMPELLRVNLLLTSRIYPAIVRTILEELQVLLAPDKEYKKVFPKVPIVGFRNNKSLKDFLVRAELPKMDNAGGSEPCGEGTCQVCDHIITTNTSTTKAYWEATLFEKCETHKQLKERETFWYHKSKKISPLGLNEKEEYLFYSHFLHKVFSIYLAPTTEFFILKIISTFFFYIIVLF